MSEPEFTLEERLHDAEGALRDTQIAVDSLTIANRNATHNALRSSYARDALMKLPPDATEFALAVALWTALAEADVDHATTVLKELQEATERRSIAIAKVNQLVTELRATGK